MYRLLVTPRWLAATAIAVSAIVAFVSLGFWQLARLEERRTYNTTLEQRGAQQPVRADELAAGDPAALAYRRVALTGRYEPEREVLLAARTLEGRAGHHVLTPLRTDEGVVVVVDRGWVPLEETDLPIAAAAPPAGSVTVEGILLPSEPARRSGSFGDDPGLEFVSALDLARLEQWIAEPVAPLAVLAQAQRPPNPGALPATPPLPEAGEGNHFSYAVQWFLFAGVVAVGFPVLVRRTARERRGGTAAPTPESVQEPAGT